MMPVAAGEAYQGSNKSFDDKCCADPGDKAPDDHWLGEGGHSELLLLILIIDGAKLALFRYLNHNWREKDSIAVIGVFYVFLQS